MRLWTTMSLQLIALIVVSLACSILFSSLLIMNHLPVWWMICIPILYLSTLLIHRGSGVLILLGFAAYFLINMPVYAPATTAQLYMLLLFAVMTGLSYWLQVILFHAQCALKVAEARVSQLIAVDPETGFDNRDRFLMDVEAERDRLIRHGETFVVSFITLPILNHFEKRYGSSEYEWFLDYFSDELHEATRRTDKKYRVAQDTFVMIFPRTSIENAQIVHERIRPLLLEYSRQNGDSLTVECSEKSFEVNLENATIRLEEIYRYVESKTKK